MTTLDDWNRALLHYVTDGLPLGSRVFLSVDSDALVAAGGFIESGPVRASRVQDFLRCVRARCILNNRVSFHSIAPSDEEWENVPPYLSFLAATVLAAYLMGEEEEISPNNYFTRLNQVLDFAGRSGRPDGLDTGTEEHMWLHWANWLTKNGFLPSARRGSGPTKFIRYPISQTLLRRADKDSLWRHFTDGNWPRNLDEDVVSMRVWRDRNSLSRHLARVLSDENMDASREEGLYQAVFDVYDLWSSSETASTYEQTSSAGSVRNAPAGLYRTFDYVFGRPEYAIFPQQPRRVRVARAEVFYQQQRHSLVPERPRWYRPLWNITAQDLENGLELKVSGTEDLDKLVLPIRDFWILTPDPEEPDSGIYATWGKPNLGTPSIILCRQSLQSQLDSLQSEGHIDWRGDPIRIWEDEDWLEYRDVMVISEGWGGVSLDNDDLIQSLRPRSLLGLSFKGGIRVPQSGGWLVGHGPEVTIHSFYSGAALSLVNPLSEDIVLLQEDLETNEPLCIEWPKEPGSFILRVTSGPYEQERSISLLDWQQVRLAEIENYPFVSIGAGAVSGSVTQTECVSPMEK